MPSLFSPRYGVFLLADFEKLMIEAFKQAEKGLGYTRPNPAVGAIIFKDGRIIARGYHRRAGMPHAEIEALGKAGEESKDGVLITTLEPCCHSSKKTPPCAEAIISAGIKTVVGAINDKNPKVNGRGYRKLRAAGINVVTGVLKDKATEFYEPYFKFITTGMPFVTLKFAQSTDGRIATTSGHSHWISSPQSLKLSHQLRAVNDSILIGRKTLAADDPELTTRLVSGSNPVRIILSESGKIPRNGTMFTDKAAPIYLATASNNKPNLKNIDRVIRVKKIKQGLDLNHLLSKLGKLDITTVLVEGGSGVLTSFLSQKLADKLIICIAPIITGNGISAIGDLGVKEIGDSIAIKQVRWFDLGPDMVITGKPVWK